ncbi:MAG: hypothetical protein WDM90_05345 [Ferruginibacter sp.]
MNTTTSTPVLFKGGEWLIKESNAFETFVPEDFNEEQLIGERYVPSILEY